MTSQNYSEKLLYQFYNRKDKNDRVKIHCLHQILIISTV
jgi:hypothetical protein